jgi:lysophospholipase L1-like esterase
MSRLAASLLAGTLLLTGCTSTGGDATPADPNGSGAATGTAPSTAAQVHTYVALGDSYSAGPLIPVTDLAGGCARSDHNYPSLVARRLGVRTFRDVTCSGATTADLTRAQHPFQGSTVPPQLRAVTEDTDLVTIGIGGNDLDLFGTLVGTCTGLRSQDPQGSPCARHFAEAGPDLAEVTRTIDRNVAAALDGIRERAPQATVVLVGYLRLVPRHGTCPGLPLATGDYAQGRRVSVSLNRALRQAARQTQVRFVDAYRLSRGHDICSAAPWVNGGVTDRQRALAYHPFASGMRAVADGVLAALRRR